MRLLILATTKFAPTYNEKLISQINYFNSFDNMKADIFIDASLVEIEKIVLGNDEAKEEEIKRLKAQIELLEK